MDAQSIIDVLRQLLELGWPAIVLVMLVVLWRKIDQLQDNLLQCYERLAAFSAAWESQNGPDV